MNLQALNNLTEDPGSVPWSIKGVTLIIVAALVGFLGYKLMLVDTLDSKAYAEKQEIELKEDLDKKQRRAALLPIYEEQLSEMQISFGNLIQQLPSGTEIPSLILDISDKGVSNGLEINMFQPVAERSKEFYAEKPIKLEAIGSYKQLATFVSDISGLSRIVTIHDIALTPISKEQGSVFTVDEGEPKNIAMAATIKTYRYLEEADMQIKKQKLK